MKTMLKGFSMDVPKEIEDAEFGLFYKVFEFQQKNNFIQTNFLFSKKKNGSSSLYWQVDTGLGELGVFQVKSWNQSKTLNYWKTEKCNQIKGTDGSGFGRHINKKDKLLLFDPNLCK